MSLNREHIIWERADGTWGIGFWVVLMPFEIGEDFDHEWDVEYDYAEFRYASVDHATPTAAKAAYHAWQGPGNPGAGDLMPYSPEGAGQVAEYDMYAAAWARKERTQQPVTPHYYSYRGW